MTVSRNVFLSLLATSFLLFSGCSEDFGAFDSAPDDFSPDQANVSGKMRHSHKFADGVKFLSRQKDGDGGALSLILGFDTGEMEAQKVLERYRVLERYKVLERYRVIERYEYQYGFDGYAIYIQDELGLDDYTAFLAELNMDPLISWFEPDFSVSLPESELASAGSTQRIPWSVAAIGGQSSWTVSGDGSGSVPVDLYVLDTGVSHSDVNVVESMDFRDDSEADAADHDGHGTHVAGIAAAIDDQDGIVGVAPGARVHNFKVLDDNGKADVSIVIAAVEHITGLKLANPSTPMVVNMSLGEEIGTQDYTALDDAIAASMEAGVVYVISAGNQGIPAYKVTPAHVADAITVGSYDLLGQFSSFSNYGPSVDILAPGEDILSLSSKKPDEIERMDGTSMAAAHVSGAAALYLAQNPSATPGQVRSALLATSRNFVTDAEPETTTRSIWVGEDAEPLTVMLVAGNGSSPSDQDQAKKALFESWGYSVIVVDDDASTSTYDAAIAQSDVAYISEESNSGDVGTKLTYAGIGVLNEEMQLTDELGLSNNRTTSFGATLSLSNASHYITQPLAGSVTLFTSAQPTHGISGTIAPGIAVLGSWSNGASLATLEAGASTYNAGAAAGRRVQLPYGGNEFDINSLTADGITVLRRAIEWAADGGTGAPQPPTFGPETSTFETRIASGDDDAEEEVDDGDMSMSSSDLELVSDGGDEQLVGMRFTNVDVPEGALITSAYIQFQVDETSSTSTDLTFRGENSGHAAAFRSRDDNLSDRKTTSASTNWSPPAWNSRGEAGADQRTPDLSGIVQEIVSRGDWNSGNAMAILVSGHGKRTAESYNGDRDGAPLLHVEWTY